MKIDTSFEMSKRILQQVKALVDREMDHRFSCCFLARAGLHNEDRLICVDDQDVTARSHRGKNSIRFDSIDRSIVSSRCGGNDQKRE